MTPLCFVLVMTHTEISLNFSENDARLSQYPKDNRKYVE